MKDYISSVKYMLMNIICTAYIRYVFQHLFVLLFIWRKLTKLLAWLTTTPCITTLFHVYHDFLLVLLKHNIKLCQWTSCQVSSTSNLEGRGFKSQHKDSIFWLRFFMVLLSSPDKCKDGTSNYVITISFPIHYTAIIIPFYVHSISHWQSLK
jgi:hypothetical protein